MARKITPPAHKIAETAEPQAKGYAVWKRAKVEAGLAQAANRDALIPADKVWRDLGLDG
jgi:hypothetical protein